MLVVAPIVLHHLKAEFYYGPTITIITWLHACCYMKTDNLLKKNNYPLLMYKSHTLDVPGIDLVKRSDSMSYFKVLKHSSRSSRNWAYVRTQAEQSQAVPCL